MAAACFDCKIRPAGTPGWYVNSAFCCVCQIDHWERNLQRNLEHGRPQGFGGRAPWPKWLQQRRAELVRHAQAMGYIEP